MQEGQQPGTGLPSVSSLLRPKPKTKASSQSDAGNGVTPQGSIPGGNNTKTQQKDKLLNVAPNKTAGATTN